MTLNCRDVHTRLTPFIDGELADAEQAPVAAHLETCPACRRVLALEQLGREVLTSRASALSETAPASLRASVRRARPGARRRLRFVWIAASAAASLVAAVGLVAIAGVIRPVPVFAAQAALDHLKCQRIGPSTAASDPTAVEHAWRQWQGWSMTVPSGAESGLTLLGYRRCALTEGRLAHLLYRGQGQMLSLFVLPDGPRVAHAELEMFGQDAVLWEHHGLTYALVGRGGRAALAAVASSLEREVDARAGATPAGASR